MSNYRSPYILREQFVDEVNSGVQLVMPDMSKSVQDIISLSMSGQDPMLSYVPDIAYGQDLSDVFPNVDELGVLDESINFNNDNVNVKNNPTVPDERPSNTDAVPEDQKEVK